MLCGTGSELAGMDLEPRSSLCVPSLAWLPSTAVAPVKFVCVEAVDCLLGFDGSDLVLIVGVAGADTGVLFLGFLPTLVLSLSMPLTSISTVPRTELPILPIIAVVPPLTGSQGSSPVWYSQGR
jgi:hypothetical protein